MAEDQRIVYGAICTWWDSIYEVAPTPGGLPGCPHCRGPLMEMKNEADWNSNIAQYAASTSDAAYVDFIAWMRGRCYKTLVDARKAWQKTFS